MVKNKNKSNIMTQARKFCTKNILTTTKLGCFTSDCNWKHKAEHNVIIWLTPWKYSGCKTAKCNDTITSRPTNNC